MRFEKIQRFYYIFSSVSCTINLWRQGSSKDSGSIPSEVNSGFFSSCRQIFLRFRTLPAAFLKDQLYGSCFFLFFLYCCAIHNASLNAILQPLAKSVGGIHCTLLQKFFPCKYFFPKSLWPSGWYPRGRGFWGFLSSQN